MDYSYLFRKILPWFGRTLMLLGMAFVIHKLWSFRHTLGSELHNTNLWIVLPLVALLYALFCSLLSFGWLALLRVQGVDSRSLSWREAWSVYGKTQIAKYIPGNVFHFIGRHALTNQKGITHTKLAAALILEIILQLMAAAFISLLAAKAIVSRVDATWSILTLVAGMGSLFVMAVIWWGKSYWAKQVSDALSWPPLAVSIANYLAFFIFSGMLFIWTVFLALGTISTPFATWPMITGCYAFAWAVGFITPGAPGGLGVREAILLLILEPVFPEVGLLVGILAFRIVTTLGDVFYFFAALPLSHKTN